MPLIAAVMRSSDDYQAGNGYFLTIPPERWNKQIRYPELALCNPQLSQFLNDYI